MAPEGRLRTLRGLLSSQSVHRCRRLVIWYRSTVYLIANLSLTWYSESFARFADEAIGNIISVQTRSSRSRLIVPIFNVGFWRFWPSLTSLYVARLLGCASRRSPLTTTRRLAPMSANTAIHMVAPPNTANTRKTALIPSASDMFCNSTLCVARDN